MFLVARPTAYPFTHPYAHPSAYSYEQVQAPFHLPFDSVHAYEQHTARRRHDELVRQRVRAAVVRAQQRREYERQLAIQAAEEEMFLQHAVRLRAQEEHRRELARQERLRQVEEARSAQRQRQLSAMRVAMAQQAIYAALEQALVEDPNVPMNDVVPEVTQERRSPASQPASLTDALHSRAQTEQDPEVLLTLNGLFQTLASRSRASSPQPTSPSQSGSIPAEKAAPAPEAVAVPTPASVPIDVVPVQDPVPARPVSPALSTSSHTTSIAALDAISSSLHNLTSDFVLPQVDFSTPASSTDSRPSSPSTHLPYTTANQPIHAYEAALSKLLDRLDSVESEGDEEIRTQRKSLVLQVEEKLKELDEAIERQRRERGLTVVPDIVSPAVETDVEIVEELPVDEGHSETAAEPIADPIVPAVDVDMGLMQGDSAEVNIAPEAPAPIGDEPSMTASDTAEFDAVIQSAVPSSKVCPPLTAEQDIAPDHDTHAGGLAYHSTLGPLDVVSPPTYTSSISNESEYVPATPHTGVTVPPATTFSEEIPDTATVIEDDEVLVTAILTPLMEADADFGLSSEHDLGRESESAHDDEHRVDVQSAARSSEILEEDWSDVKVST